MLSKYIFFVFVLIISFLSVSAQIKGTGPKEKTFKQDLKSSKQIRKENREKRKIARAEKKAIKKYHKRLQTKTVRKRMKSSRKNATRYNDNRKEFFIKRWFKNSKLGRKRR